ncbi:hypothetical protein HU200_030025 [Digitaria exilis]|uniref:Acetyltransferase n=1 Tax=Digitaria exilis TaxID=1010633 RepID=A0A835BS50_9POAL|nr:hypothetical protein HU200_030025 [Digitaria exilis]
MPGSTDTGRVVHVISRRVVRAEPPPSSSPVPETIHLMPWDLRLITIDYIQKGVLLPKPPSKHAAVVERLASSFARALGLFHPFAGRLAVDESAGDETITVSLRCTGEGAEFIHASAPGVTAADIAGELYIPRDLVASLFPLNGLVSADAASPDGEPRRAPLLAAQVTELDDAVFVAASLNHAVGDGTTFWHFFNTWSDLCRSGGGATTEQPPPVLERWFLDTCPVPVPLKFANLEDTIRRHDDENHKQQQQAPLLQECFFHFSGETPYPGRPPLLSPPCRLRLEPWQETTYVLLIRCRGRVKGIPAGSGYVGNAVVPCKVRSTAGEVMEKGLGWTAWQLNRAVASLDDEAALVRESLERWVSEPTTRLAYNTELLGPADVGTGSSPRFDVYGNDFGWGKPEAVRCGPGNKLDGKTTVFEGRGGGGAMALEVCLAADALGRLVADDEFVHAVTKP